MIGCDAGDGVNRVRDDDVWLNTHLVGDIYDAVADPVGRLRSVMDTLARELGCDAAYFKLVSHPDGEVLAGVGGGMVDGSDRDYLANYLESDVRVPRVALAPRRTILDDRQLITPTERRRSLFHNEWVPRYDLAHLMHVNIAQSLQHTAIVTCAQATGRGEFDTRQRRLLALYVPHFERAVLLQLRLLELGQQAALMNEAFVHL
jgi:hypothetical protein